MAFLTGEAKPRKSLVVGQSGVSKSVSKLLLAASASKARSIVVTWYFMFAFGLLHVRFQEWPKEGPLFESDSNKRWGPK